MRAADEQPGALRPIERLDQADPFSVTLLFTIHPAARPSLAGFLSALLLLRAAAAL